MSTAQKPIHKRDDTVELRITDIAESDRWYGELPDGRGVFVRGPAAIDDEVRAQIIGEKRRYLEARLVEVISPSSKRVPPVCSHFGVCGGCKCQHLDYSEQLRLKHLKVENALKRIGQFNDISVASPIPSDHQTHYRNKIEFSFSDKRYLIKDGDALVGESRLKPRDFALGFHAPRIFDKIVDIDYCHIATPNMNKILDIVKEFSKTMKLPPYSTRKHEGYLRHLVIREVQSDNQLMVNLVTSVYDEKIVRLLADRLIEEIGSGFTTLVNNLTSRKSEVSKGEKEVVVYGPGYITESLGGYRFRLSADSFFQTNTAQAEHLLKVITKLARLSQSDIVYDLYCGAGAFTITLSSLCRKILGIETVATAVADAQSNAKLNGVGNCEFLQGDLNKPSRLTACVEDFGRPDVVILDPPRAGVHPKTVGFLLSLCPARIVYVSCNPASLARDSLTICSEGNYEMQSVQPIDMFPFTNHIESVALIVRKDEPQAGDTRGTIPNTA